MWPRWIGFSEDDDKEIAEDADIRQQSRKRLPNALRTTRSPIIVPAILSKGFMELEGIDHVAVGVRDIKQSADWYIEVLGFERLHENMWDGIPIFIGKGNTAIALFPAKPDSKPPSLSHRERRMLHLAFRANRENFVAAQRELKNRGIEFEFQDHEISHSIYFRDPDGHALEITTYEL